MSPTGELEGFGSAIGLPVEPMVSVAGTIVGDGSVQSWIGPNCYGTVKGAYAAVDHSETRPQVHLGKVPST